jgi:hypothetical protein
MSFHVEKNLRSFIGALPVSWLYFLARKTSWVSRIYMNVFNNTKFIFSILETWLSLNLKNITHHIFLFRQRRVGKSLPIFLLKHNVFCCLLNTVSKIAEMLGYANLYINRSTPLRNMNSEETAKCSTYFKTPSISQMHALNKNC